MPPRKNPPTADVALQQQQQVTASFEGIEAFELPRALVTRIAKSGLPENVKMQKEVVTALVKGSTVFINYLAATAQEIANQKQHKSVSASDVLRALEAIDFGDMVEGLQTDLTAFRELQKAKKAASAAGGSASVGGSSASAGPSAATSAVKLKLPARVPASGAPVLGAEEADIDVDENLLAELQAEDAEADADGGEEEEEGIDDAEGEGMDVDEDAE